MLKYCKFFVAILLLIFTFVSCSESAHEDPAGQKSHVRVELGGFLLEVDDMGSMARAEQELSTAATRLSFAVFNSEGTLVETIQQVSTDNTFGTVEMDLYPGTYQMVAIAHNGTSDAEIQSATSAILPGTTLTDTFAKVQTLTVEKDKNSSLSMTLPRITSAFILKLNDTPPANLKEIQVVVNTGGFLLSQVNPSTLGINPSTGLASKDWEFPHTIPVEDISKNLPLYFIGINSPSTVTVKATAYATDGTEIISHTLSNVSLEPNRKTIASGNFFKSQGSGTFTINSTWATDNNINY